MAWHPEEDMAVQAEASVISWYGGSAGSDILRNGSCRVHISVLRFGARKGHWQLFFFWCVL